MLAPVSVPELTMHRCVHEKDTLRTFLIGLSSLPIVVAQPDEKLVNRTFKNGTLRWCGYWSSGQATAECLASTHK